MDTLSVWVNYAEKSFFLYKNKEDTHPLLLYPGICITWDGREDYVKIVNVLGRECDEGPRGFSFLPWRKEGRWATPHITLRGDARFAICYPTGFPHYGLHLPLHTIKTYEAPEYTMRADISYDYKGAMIQLQHGINMACHEAELHCVENNCVFTCSTMGIEFAIYVLKTASGYKLNFLHRSGSKDEFQMYAETISSKI